MPALRIVLRPQVPSWKRPEVRPERRPWLMEDQDPEPLARESIAELQEALKGLHAIRELLR